MLLSKLTTDHRESRATFWGSRQNDAAIPRTNMQNRASSANLDEESLRALSDAPADKSRDSAQATGDIAPGLRAADADVTGVDVQPTGAPEVSVTADIPEDSVRSSDWWAVGRIVLFAASFSLRFAVAGSMVSARAPGCRMDLSGY